MRLILLLISAYSRHGVMSLLYKSSFNTGSMAEHHTHEHYKHKDQAHGLDRISRNESNNTPTNYKDTSAVELKNTKVYNWYAVVKTHLPEVPSGKEQHDKISGLGNLQKPGPLTKEDWIVDFCQRYGSEISKFQCFNSD